MAINPLAATSNLPNPAIDQFYEGLDPAEYSDLTGTKLNRAPNELLDNLFYLEQTVSSASSVDKFTARLNNFTIPSPTASIYHLNIGSIDVDDANLGSSVITNGEFIVPAGYTHVRATVAILGWKPATNTTAMNFGVFWTHNGNWGGGNPYTSGNGSYSQTSTGGSATVGSTISPFVPVSTGDAITGSIFTNRSGLEVLSVQSWIQLELIKG